MSANPLQGIQVINSVNPCSSTPLHRPIYPYHLPGFPISLPRIFALLSPYSPLVLPSLARSSSLHLSHSPTWNLDSPLSGTTHPPPRLQEKVENCDYKDFPDTPPVAPLPPCNPSRSPFAVPCCFCPLLTARNLPHLLSSLLLSPFFLPSLFSRLFLIPSSPFTALPRSSLARALLLGLKL